MQTEWANLINLNKKVCVLKVQCALWKSISEEKVVILFSILCKQMQ